jgi:flagellar protein FliS
MNPNTYSALNAYTRSALEMEVNSANPHRLILMLFDGALAAIAAAKGQIQRQQTGEKGVMLSKAISILEEGLRLSLDKTAGGELAQQLDALYEYMSHRLLMANINNDVAAIDEVTGLLTVLRDAWQQIGVPTQAAVAPAPQPGQVAASYGKA